jgi:beta-aspartyl-dipeptidase (metallo-type)
MLKVVKNAVIYSPKLLGKKDILLGGEKILHMADSLEGFEGVAEIIDVEGKYATPGFIDQHVHIIGAGGKHGYASMTPEIMVSDFIGCGTTTVVGMLGTDASARSIKTLYAKTKALDSEGISAYMLTSYFGIDPVTITGRIQDDLIFIDKVLGCKVAISDERSSYPTTLELLRHLRDVHVGGLISGKGGIMHVHLGGLSTKMDILFQLVEEFEFPIKHISATHVGRSEVLFQQAIKFAKMGAIIDITTGASKFTEPWKSVKIALEAGVSMDNLSFSSDGHAGISKRDSQGKEIGFGKAPIHQNFMQMRTLVQEGGVDLAEALQLITTNPAKNLSLKQKGILEIGADADICFLNTDLELTDVIARGQRMMVDGRVLAKNSFEN